MFTKALLGLSTVAIMITGAAVAETTASAWTDLNVRSGPSTMYSVVGVIGTEDIVTIDGCLEDGSWCKITNGEVTGWSSGNYLTATVEEKPVILSTLDTRIVTETVTYDHTAEAAAGGLATGVVAGAMIAGPVGAILGGIVGVATGAAVAPDPTVVTYVKANPVETVYLDGEVVVGAEIPASVTLMPVPESQYSYAYINGVRVLVKTDQRAVAYIVR